MSASIYLLFALISLAASAVGAVCGIGGGVMMKPAFDALGILSVPTISFLSGCTVLGMALYSVIKAGESGGSHIDWKLGTPLAVGAAAGGVAGKFLFHRVSEMVPDHDLVGAAQAACLAAITLGTLIYTLNKRKISTYHVKNYGVCLVIGLFLGILSSFLGIGGGPINLVVLFFFFSMDTKTAAQNSLYIILFSQITSLVQTVLTGAVPEFDILLLILMVICGILGGICGRAVNDKLDGAKIDRVFMVVMTGIILVNIFNVYRFLS